MYKDYNYNNVLCLAVTEHKSLTPVVTPPPHSLLLFSSPSPCGSSAESTHYSFIREPLIPENIKCIPKISKQTNTLRNVSI